jgi:hypothetical protein
VGSRKAKTKTKLASISALGAGAMALCSPSPAVAGTIVDFKGMDTNLPTTVGPIFSSSAFESKGMGPLSARFVFHTFRSSSRTYSVGIKFAGAGGRGAALRFATTSGHLAIVGPGAMFTTSFGVRGAGRVATMKSRYTFITTPSGGTTTTRSRFRVGLTHNFSNEYALFEFNGGSHEDFGWVQLSLSWFGDFPEEQKVHGEQIGTFAFPFLTISDYAYDSSGAFIPAGDTGVPEPDSFELAGLGALMLGAAGVRRWRTAKKAAA